MRVAVDLDGVVYEWQRTYRYMMNQYRGTTMPPVEEFWDRWDAADEFTTRADRDWIWTKGIDLGLFRYGHVVTGAIVGLKELAAAGFHLVVVTHRPERAVPDTIDWLAYTRLPWSAVHILSNGEPKTVVDAEILVDDKTENILDWVVEGRHGIVFDRPWNQDGRLDMSPAKRAKNWNQVVTHAKQFKWADERKRYAERMGANAQG